MAYGSIPLDKRLKDNIKNYKLDILYNYEEIEELIKAIYKLTKVDILVTDRHGEKSLAVGEWTGTKINVEEKPGTKIRICNRTVAHAYFKYDNVDEADRQMVKRLVESTVHTYECMGEKAYIVRELEIYTDELEEKLEKETYQAKNGEKKDALTGALNRTYFDNRLKIIDRSQVVPVAAICININDWKYVNDHYGDEESDRLISLISDFIIRDAKQDYVIGRVDGDVFNVIIPMPAAGEVEDYCKRVKEACESYVDDKLAPSVAIGTAIKENVETDMAEVLSDAEYVMFENKIEVKNAPGYRSRLTHGAE